MPDPHSAPASEAAFAEVVDEIFRMFAGHIDIVADAQFRSGDAAGADAGGRAGFDAQPPVALVGVLAGDPAPHG